MLEYQDQNKSNHTSTGSVLQTADQEILFQIRGSTELANGGITKTIAILSLSKDEQKGG
ncbi:hypothetical protein [uncultured Christiangramia sp.]|uniref:hypothetical protein n=1 Tax=uncultured Christiangramia sp. TaxID=503836 RepID=UPI0025D1F4A1|nr:hypothetical protein [uncultured Christiangramia sp.]